MDDDLGPAIVRVEDLAPAPAAHDQTRVSNLATRLGVAGRPVEDDLDSLALARLASPCPVPFPDDRPDARRRCQRVVAQEALGAEGLWDRRVEGARVGAFLHPEPRARPRPLALSLHLLLVRLQALRGH